MGGWVGVATGRVEVACPVRFYGEASPSDRIAHVFYQEVRVAAPAKDRVERFQTAEDGSASRRRGVADIIEIESRNMKTIRGEPNQCQARSARLDPEFQLTSPISELLVAGLLVVTALSLVAVPAKITVPTDQAGPPVSSISANLRNVPFGDLKIADVFWLSRQETYHVASPAMNLKDLEKSANLQALRFAVQSTANGSRGPVYWDSGVCKATE